MNCTDAQTVFYESDSPSLPERAALAFHILFCGDCAAEYRRFGISRALMRKTFLPPAPRLEEAIMARIILEDEASEAYAEEDAIPGGVSTRGWVAVGIFIFVSLAGAFAGRDFIGIAAAHLSSFLVPLGIFTGIFITGYGALFIGSHLKELTERFGIH
jgi:hypothetical protein